MEIPIKYLNDYAVNLAETLTEKSKADFFKEVHAQYYSNYDISFMDFFLEIIKNDGDFCIEHTKLIEYGVLSTTRSNDIKSRLETHGLNEGVNFTVLARKQRGKTGATTKNFYYLTPDVSFLVSAKLIKNMNKYQQVLITLTNRFKLNNNEYFH